MHSSVEARVSRILLLIGLNGFLFYALLFLLNSLVLILGGKVYVIFFWLSALLAIFVSTFLGKKEHSIEEIFLGALGSILLFAGTYVYQVAKLDVSWDGVSYHAQAVLEFVGGWNPYYYDLPSETPYRIWLSHYPVASWLTAASVYAALPLFSGMKVFSMFLPLSAFCLATGVLKRFKFSWLLASLLGWILALNPVSVVEYRSLYLDGQLASCWLTLVLLLIWRYQEKNNYFFILFTLVCIVVINLKFTGLVLAILVTLIGLLAYLLLKRADLFVPLACAGGLAVSTAFWGIGYVPYVKNLAKHGHIFYPLMGSQETRVEIMENNDAYRKTYGDKSHFYKFITSYGSYCQHIGSGLTWRIPFATNADEQFVWGPGEWITSGFGPMFSGILLVLAVVVGAAYFQPAFQPHFTNFVVIASAYLAAVLIIPENWLARYVPHFWFFPWFIWAFFWLKTTNIWQKVVLLALLVVGYWNVGHVADHSTKLQNWSENRWWSDYQILGYGKTYAIDWGKFPALARRTREHGINFQTVNSPQELTCNQVDRIQLGNLPSIWACPLPN